MNPWKILGVNRQTSQAEVRDAYLNLARKHHPDVTGEGDQQFSVITGAYSLLKNAEETKKFVAQLRAVSAECGVCGGKGATYKQRGMTARVATTCKECGGAGLLMRKGKQK